MQLIQHFNIIAPGDKEDSLLKYIDKDTKFLDMK